VSHGEAIYKVAQCYAALGDVSSALEPSTCSEQTCPALARAGISLVSPTFSR
jgi:hypothetical protein